jgi:Thioredoxin like C-terminal domain
MLCQTSLLTVLLLASLNWGAQDNVRRVRPERDNIAAPDLPQGIPWIGEEPRSMPMATAAGPALVHFIDFAQLNSVRTLPYVAEWDRRYRDAGLRTIGVQAPRFPFGVEPDQVAAGLQRLGVEFPVAIDAERALWHSYGCRGWPSLFLWSMGGALAWFHFGEGEYTATEEAIQAELRELDALRELPAPMAQLRPTDAPGARVMPPSPEVFPGSWERAWTAGEDGAELALSYEAGGAFATLEGEGEVTVELDGEAVAAVPVGGGALYPLVEHPRHESHELILRPSPGLRVWSVSFAAGMP